jgi:hypothetical protein
MRFMACRTRQTATGLKGPLPQQLLHGLLVAGKRLYLYNCCHTQQACILMQHRCCLAG